MSKHTLTHTRSYLIAALCALAAGTATAIAIADDSTPSQPDPAPALDPLKRTTAVATVPPEVAEKFAVFRQPPSPMPADVAERAASPTLYGRNPALARKIETVTGTGWVVPGDGWMCLIVPIPKGLETTTCQPTDAVVKNGLALRLTWGNGKDPQWDTIVVPDGTTTVQFGAERATPSALGIVSRVSPPDAPDAKIAARDSSSPE